MDFDKGADRINQLSCDKRSTNNAKDQNVEKNSSNNIKPINFYESDQSTTSTSKEETQKYQPFYESNKLPKELTKMFGALACLLCDVNVGSTLTAKSHYQGKGHMKKVKAFLVAWCQKTGNPMPELPSRRHISVSNLGEDRCSLCDVNFNSLADAEIHYSGKNHLKRLQNPTRPAKRQKIDTPVDPTGRFGIGVDFSLKQDPLVDVPKIKNEVKPKFFCDLCAVQAIDENQLQQHLNGIRHFKTLKAKKCTVVPAPVNPADSILASVCKTDENFKKTSDYSMHRTPTGHYYCQICNLTMNSEDQFCQHIESKKHKTKISSGKTPSSTEKNSLSSN